MIILLLFLTFLAGEAQQHDAHPATVAAPATLMPGIGTLHHPIATRSPDAQRFFNQGLTLVYGFNHDEAIRAFRRAAELDPLSPMPRWGIAYALGPNINLDVDPEREKAAYEEAQRAVALAAAAPPKERAYVEALATRYSNDPKADLKTLAVQFKDAMREVSRRYPDDLDAATLYAESLMNLRPWQLWSLEGKPAEGTEEIVAVLEGVLRRDPRHVGANHYYIHAVEASKSPGRALPSARRLGTLVPAAGHLVHMPAHIFMRIGDYAAAEASNAKAAAVDREYIARTKAGGVYPMMYYNHNLDFLAAAAMMNGRYGEAARAADELVANVLPAIAQMPMIEPIGAKKLFVLLRFSRGDDVLTLPKPDAAHPILTAISHFGRGVVYATRGNVAEAERERAAYVEARMAVAADADWGFNKARTVLAVADLVLDARIAWAKGDRAVSIQAWRNAVAAEDLLSYDEPPDWFYPTRESLGAALVVSGRPEEAERTFRDDLERNPRNGRSLFGLAQALRAQKKPAAAIDRQFRAAWNLADVKLRIEDY